MNSEPRNEARHAWFIVFMLWLFMLINFADKAILGLAAVPIMEELSLKPAEFGLLGSSFFFLFAVSAIFVGFVVNRLGTRWPIFVMAVVWALLQLPMIAGVGFATLMTCRIILGAGEGPAYPTAVHATYNWFPNARRVLPTLILALGASAGLLVAPALTYVIVHVSWHWAFGLLGIVGLAWAIGWLAFGCEAATPPPIPSFADRNIAHIPYRQLLTNRTTIATVICGFVSYSGLSLLLVWFTPYLNVALGFPLQQAGWLTALPPTGLAVVMAVSGYWSQRAVLGGAGTRYARGLLAAIGTVLGGIAIVLIPLFRSNEMKVAMMVLGIGLPSAIYVLAHPIVSEFTPERQRAAVLSITNAVITLAGIVAPYAMGRIIERSSSPIAGYENGFLLCGAATIAGGIIGVVFLRPESELVRLSRGIVPASDTM